MALTLSGDDGVAGVNGSATTPAIQGTDTNTGISFGTDTVNVVTGGTTRATVDANGDFSVNTDAIFVDASTDRVGVGTNAPDSPVHIKGTGQTFPRVETTSSTNDAGWKIKNGTREWSTFVNGTDGAYRIYDETASSERMRIISNGAVLVDCSSLPGSSTQGFGFFPDTNVVQLLSASGSTSATAHAEFFNPNGKVGTITTDGTTTSYNQSSDYRLKENVVDLNGAIDRVKQLAPKRFNFIADANKTVDGFLAHETQAVVPEAVFGAKDAVDADGNPEYQGIDQSKLVPLLTAALQEAIGKIEALETRVAQLEGGAS